MSTLTADGSGATTQTGREPALDGLRGLAVAAVLVFHADLGWAPGGFLGVSLFFTLSGYLITRMLVPRGAGGAGAPLSLRTFWARRARRLLPALLVTLLGVVVLARTALTRSESIGLRGDLVAGLAQVSNWWFLAEGRSYAALFEAPSLVLHLWSLSIEMQLYLLLPLLLVGLRRRGWEPERIGLVVVALALVSLGMTLSLDGRIDRIYYGTDTRAFELLAGSALALLGPAVAARRGLWQAAGAVALAASAAMWVTVGSATGWLYRGGLAAHAVLAAIVIAGLGADGPLTRALGVRPLRRLGEISYAVYLFHWPIFLWLSPRRLDISPLAAAALATAATLAAALVSEAVLELPIRRGRGMLLARPRRAAPAAAVATVVVLIAIGVGVPTDRPRADLGDRGAAAEAVLDEPTRAPLPGAPRTAFFGDSTSLALGLGVGYWAARSGELAMASGSVDVGCGLIDRGVVRFHEEESPLPKRCRTRGLEYEREAAGLDLAVYMGGPWDVADMLVPGAERWQSIEDPAIERLLEEAADRVADRLTAGGATMVWILIPRLEAGVEAEQSPRTPLPSSDPARVERFNEIGLRLARDRPGEVVVLDLASWMRAQPGGELSRALRPDGVHLTETTAAQVAARYIGPELVRIAAER